MRLLPVELDDGGVRMGYPHDEGPKSQNDRWGGKESARPRPPWLENVIIWDFVQCYLLQV